jgi:hypothetical protein
VLVAGAREMIHPDEPDGQSHRRAHENDDEWCEWL